jgi:aspartate kinase
MKKVVKFGGSSLASSGQFKKVGEIIRSDPDRRYVVPSAPGKRFDADVKVTDMLYDCYRRVRAGKSFTNALDNIRERYQEIIDGLGMDLSLWTDEFKTIERNFRRRIGEDYAASRGENI